MELPILFIVFFCTFVLSANSQTETTENPALAKCDKRNDRSLREGNIGESSNFPWLGVLRVYYYLPDHTKRIALTGIVLISNTHALASADDVSKIPESSLSALAKAQFIKKDQEPMFAKVIKYSLHPEYGFSTDATIALVHLDLVDEAYHAINPICLPKELFNFPTTKLYVLGYTDENQLLEKTIHRLKYVNKSMCDEFYEGTQLTMTKNTKPVYYHCGVAKNTNSNCNWDNGMIMATNETGVWTLVGFAFKGPNCRSPGRFLDVSQYTLWFESSMDLEEPEDDPYD